MNACLASTARPAGHLLLRLSCLAVSLFAAYAALAEDVIADEAESEAATAHDHSEGLAGRLSFHAFADVETAYICRGAIYDTRPFSAQYAALEADLGPFGVVEPSIWTYSAMSSSGQSSSLTRYAYAEADYLLRYYYDIDFAEGWRLRNGVGKQWVTNPGFRGGRTVVDWQALQVLQTPWLTPYWRLRVIRRPFQELFWVVGLKRSFPLTDDLSLTLDLSGDLGDNSHYVNLYGPRGGVDGARYTGGLKDLMFVARLDYALVDHVSLFAFVGQFCLVSSDARDAIGSLSGPESRRDITFGGAGVAIDF